MDSSRLLDSAHDPYARRQAPSMGLPTSLSSGQPYYTVESLEGASSLPLLKRGFASSAPLPSERDALLRSDAQTRALLADRETLDARARLLAAEREALLRRSVSGSFSADQRAYVDGLPPADARTRLDGLPPADAPTRLDGLPPADARTLLDGLPPAGPRARLDGLPADARTRLDGLSSVDARTRPSLDDLRALDARTRLDGLPVDARTRLDGLRSVDTRTRPYLDDLRALDKRVGVLAHEFDWPPHDALRMGTGFDERGRAPATVDGPELALQDHRALLEMARGRDFAAVTRSGPAPFYPPIDSLQPRPDIADVRTLAMPLDSSFRRRDIADIRAMAMPLESSFRRRDIADVRTPVMTLDSPLMQRDMASQLNASSFRLQSERSFLTRSQKPAAPRPAPAEVPKKQNKTFNRAASPIEKSKRNLPSEQSDTWCALCKIECNNIKSLGYHLKGKKHKAMVEGNPVKANEDSEATKPTLATQAERKRASEAKPEASQKAKRPKTTSALAIGNGAPMPDVADAKKGKGDAKVDDFKKEKAKKRAAENGKESNHLVCELCNITATGQKNLEYHLKGKRHAARLKELANS